MARRVEQEQGSDRSKVRVFYAEAEGSNQSLQDLLRAMTTAMSRPVQVVALPPKRVANSSEAAMSSNSPSEPGLFNTDGVDQVEPAVNEGDVVEPEPPGVSRRRRGDGPKVDRNSGLGLVPNLDFVPSGKIALKAFLAEKSPANDMEQILVLAHYLQHTLALAPYGPAHILTAYKHVGKPVPVDLRGTIRNMKRGKAWLNFTDPDDIRVTTEGDNVVEHELPRSRGDGGIK